MGEIKRLRSSVVWVILIVAVIALWFIVVNNDSSAQRKDFSAVAAEIKDGRVSRLEQSQGSSTVWVYYKDDTPKAKTILPSDRTDIFETLANFGIDPSTVPVDVKPASRWGNWLSAVGFLLPTLFLIAIFVFMMRQAQGSNNQAISFGKSRARLFTGNKPTVTFADVAGVDEAKEELVEVVPEIS